MIQVLPSEVTPEIRELFDPDAPAGLRCLAVLDGQSVGRVWVDTLPYPRFGIVREAAFGSLYFGGTLDAAAINAVVSDLRPRGDVLIGLWPDDRLWGRLSVNPDYVGSVLEFSRRIADASVPLLPEAIPEGCHLRHLDCSLFKGSMMAGYFLRVYGSAEKALQEGIGLCLMRGQEILSEGSSGPSANGLIEIGVETKKEHRHHGYATWVCSRLMQECEELGLGTYWNCDAQNPASTALARKLGYRSEKHYKLVAWLRQCSLA